MRVHRSIVSWLMVCLLGGCVADPEDESRLAPGRTDPYAWWRTERARRQAELDQYLRDNAPGLAAFTGANLGKSGVPGLVFGVLPDVFPDIWGTPDQHFGPVGLGPNPWDAAAPLPLGAGWATTDPLPVPSPPFPVAEMRSSRN